MSPEYAEALLASLKSGQPEVVQLAMYLSPAARIEPALLRMARLEFLPASDAGLESDLWFSPLEHF